MRIEVTRTPNGELRVEKVEADYRRNETAKLVTKIRELHKDGVGPTELAKRFNKTMSYLCWLLYDKRSWACLNDKK